MLGECRDQEGAVKPQENCKNNCTASSLTLCLLTDILDPPGCHRQTLVSTEGRSALSNLEVRRPSQSWGYGCKSLSSTSPTGALTPNAQTLAACQPTYMTKGRPHSIPPHPAPRCLGSRNLHLLSRSSVTEMCTLL